MHRHLLHRRFHRYAARTATKVMAQSGVGWDRVGGVEVEGVVHWPGMILSMKRYQPYSVTPYHVPPNTAICTQQTTPHTSQPHAGPHQAPHKTPAAFVSGH